jgi:acetyl-CoA C-acetyltransferase
MQRDIAIVAQAMVLSDSTTKSRERTLFDLVKGLYDGLGITRHDIGTFVLNSNDFEVGHTIANVFEDSPVGAYLKDETHVDSDGLWAAQYATMRMLSGNYDTALLVGDSFGATTFRPYLAMDYQLNPTYDRQLGVLNELSTAALQARAYMEKYGVDEDAFNEIAARMLRDAAKNPDAMRSRADATAGDVLASDYLYEPLRELACYPFTDGACAMVLAAGDRARELTDKPVWIKGLGNSIDSYYIGERDLATSPSTKTAADSAYKLAGIKPSEVDVAEVSAKFAHQEPIICEGLGLSAEGAGGKVDGVAVSPSGGGLGGYLFTANGLVRIAECVKQLRGEAGKAQVPGAKIALAHGQDGFCMQHNAVLVMSTEEG